MSDDGKHEIRGEGSAQPAKEESQRRPRVLVVEDQAVIAMEIEDALRELGVEVVGTAGYAEEAIRLTELHRPDVVTMDINLGSDRDGISVALEIYDRFQVRPIFISAYGNRDVMDRAHSARPVAWISKPVEPVKLQRALESAFR